MALLTIKDVHQTYGDRHLFRGVSLVVGERERIGLLGPNGCGKSTLLRILAGTETPDRGERTVRRDLRLAYLEQDPVLADDQTVRQVVALGMSGRSEVLAALDRIHQEMARRDLEPADLERLLAEQQRWDERLHELGGHDVEHRIDAMLTHLGLPRSDALCRDLSGGERRRAALAQLLLAQPELVLLDEPTNHLDALVTQWLEQFLLAKGTPLVMVTHDRYFLDRVVDRIVEIDRGELHEYRGGYGDFLVARAARLEREGKQESTRRNLLRREAEWMRRGPPARTTKSKARIQRFHGLEGAAPEAGGEDLAFRIPEGPRLGERVLEVAGVTKSFGDRQVLAGVDIEIGKGTRLGIVGPNGAGKTTFLQICSGELEPDSGTVTIGSTVRFSGIDQKRTQLDDSKTVLEEVGGANDYVVVGDRSVRIETFLEQFLFTGAMKHTRIGKLSGGERNRVLLAKLLSAGGNVILLDEPTNDLDLMSLRVLEEALVAFPGAVLVVSHDRYFLDRVATRILHLDGDGKVRIHEGDLSSLLGRIDAEVAQPAKKPPSAVPTKSKAVAARRRPSSAEKRELEQLPARIQGVEEEISAIDEQLADPSLYSDGAGDVGEIVQRRAALQEKLAGLYARWEELESLG